jgi:hypothetical protein
LSNSPFSHIFAGSNVVVKQACNMDQRPAVREPARGNVMCVGDNAAYAETAIKGALGCGYMAARLSKQALDGGDGDANAAYNDYWQNAFNFFNPAYSRRVRGVKEITHALTDAETDTLFAWVEGHGLAGLPNDVIIDNREQFERELPEISAKLLPSEEQGQPAGRAASVAGDIAS